MNRIVRIGRCEQTIRNSRFIGMCGLAVPARHLDRGFVGTRAVRRVTLLEVHDHLPEARESALAGGAHPEEANRRAIEAVGDREALNMEMTNADRFEADLNSLKNNAPSRG